LAGHFQSKTLGGDEFRKAGSVEDVRCLVEKAVDREGMGKKVGGCKEELM
jgi:hypothetical protein